MASLLERFSKWLQLKVYQVEVTFSVYMFTPLEKLFFCKQKPPSPVALQFFPRFYPHLPLSVAPNSN